MADKSEDGNSDEERSGTRPASGTSKTSKSSEMTIGDTVSKLTVKALKEFRLSDQSDADTATGDQSLPEIDLLQDVTNIDLTVPPEQTSVSSEQDHRPEAGVDLDEANEENILLGDQEESDEETDGESEMVVLDPDHVRLVSMFV